MATEIYKCDKCNAVYYNKKDAEGCENAHIRPKGAVCFTYECGKAIPDGILMDFGDGVLKHYWISDDEHSDAERILGKGRDFNDEYKG